VKVESVAIATLSQDPANARKHDDKNLEAIKASLRRFGQQKPIVVDSSNVVRAGNGTLAAATALGWDSINVVQTDLQGSEATAYAIADNRTAELADWDESVLAASLSSLADVDETWLSDLQFSEKEIAELVASTQEQEIIEDEVPDLTTDPVTQTGDLWILGEHRLLCGDSTSESEVGRLMNGERANLLLTDPPYGINISANPVRQKHKKSNWDSKPIDPTVFAKSVDEYIVWGGNYFNLPANKGFFVWDKKQPEDFTLAMVELAQTNIDTPAKMFRKSVTSYSKQHPTQKPVELLAWCLKYADGLVFDPFLGSGSTLIAAEQLDRICYGLEISPEYCDVIVERWQNLTGKKARLEGGGATA
jgi:hypothetical protein